MKILAFDPGGTTGWCEHTKEENSWVGGQIDAPEHQHHRVLWNFLRARKPDVVVYEAFNYQIRKLDGVQMPGVVLISREYIGVIRLYCELSKTPCVKQQPSILSIPWCRDESLKRLGLHTRGAPHQNDATRHMLYYLVDPNHGLGLSDYLRPLRD